MNDLIPALRAVCGLMASGGWRELPGIPGTLVLIRTWPDDSVDALTVHDDRDAFAHRTNPAGTPVWNHIGAVSEVVEALRQVPPPSDPGAPRESLGAPNRDRDMGTP
jgi:hypothetical protein